MAEKANRYYVQQKVNPILENMLVDLLVVKPDNVIEYMQLWIKEKGKQFQCVNTAAIQTLDQLKTIKKTKDEEGISSAGEHEEEEIDQIQENLMEKQKQKGTTRSAVSAEAYGQFNKKENYVPSVISKTEEIKNKISKRIMQSFMFSSLEDKDRNIVIDAMQERIYKVGEYIIRQGDDGDLLFVLESGTADCYKQFSKTEEQKFLKKYVAGESFGELSLLYNCPRAASVVVVTECRVWALDRNTFNHIVKDSASKKREKYEQFLSKVEILKDMDPYERMQIADALKTINCKAGEVVVRQGEEGDIFFMVEEGQLEAFIVNSPGSEPESVLKYHKEMYFGELALIKNQPRAASIVCTSDSTLVALDRYTFKRLLGPLETILKRNAESYEKFGQ